MKRISKIARYAKTILPLCCLASCSYLDVVPPETEDIKDMMKNEDATLSFVYSCYNSLQWGYTDPIDYRTYESSTDEFVVPTLWNRAGQIASWNQLSSQYKPNWDTKYAWQILYDAIGHCNLFLDLLVKLNPDIAPEKKLRFAAEVKCVKAYYYSRLLERFGPVPIIDTYPEMNMPASSFPGRSHYDYCVDYVVRLLEEAEADLPAVVADDDLGRATSTICKALKARVLLTAASPLWNGSFPYKNWKNTNYETPEYGKELVSNQYSAQKWERALTACEEALTLALGDGKRELLDIAQSENIRTGESVPLPVIPGLDTSTPEGQEFQKRVVLMRYVLTAIETVGNKERVWGAGFAQENLDASMPHNLVYANGNWTSMYGGIAPTLNTMESFYTANGVLPDNDKNFPAKDDRLNSAGLSSNSNIIKLNVNREPRYYAWLSFDGDEYSSLITDGNPMFLDMRSSDKQGYNPDKFNRDNSATGFLSKKFVFPSVRFRSNDGWYDKKQFPFPIIRLSELYLNLAECYAYLAEKEGHADYVEKALDKLNDIRRRAGIRELVKADIAGNMTLLKWVESERFIELWGEGHRYRDARRWMTAPDYFKAGVREGLNAIQKKDPSFREFNQRVKIDQPFQWANRMYLMPIPASEVYANPQLEQSPEY